MLTSLHPTRALAMAGLDHQDCPHGREDLTTLSESTRKIDGQGGSFV